jgi:hypothetical protein
MEIKSNINKNAIYKLNFLLLKGRIKFLDNKNLNYNYIAYEKIAE